MLGPLNRGNIRISGLVVEYIVAIDVTRVRFPADAFCFHWLAYISVSEAQIRGVAGLWRNGSASDSRSDGWAFESLWPHFQLNLGHHEDLRPSRNVSSRVPR